MKEEKISFKFRKKKISIKARKLIPLEMGRGLMFRKRKNARALLFELPAPGRMAIHSFFVFFPFIAVWLGEKSEIVDVKIVKPFSFYVCPTKKFARLIEIPVNKKYEKFRKFFMAE